MEPEKIADIRRIVRGLVRENEPMSMHTTYGVGGPADVYVEPADESDLAALLKWASENRVPWLAAGGGSNMLVSDAGIRGIVIRMGKPFSYIRVNGERVTAGAGAVLAKVIDAAVQAGLGGLEYATAVPGSIGGAMVMNAGTHLGCVGDSVESVRVLRSDGTAETMTQEDMQFSYRHSILQEDRSRIVTEVTFHLRPSDREKLLETVRYLKQRRNDTQPVIGRSAGCMFKNPPGGKAGMLIDQAGLKGMRRGDAMVSEQHANFILNMGNATAADIRGLAEEVRRIVEDKYGVRLDYEVRIVGDWTGFEEA